MLNYPQQAHQFVSGQYVVPLSDIHGLLASLTGDKPIDLIQVAQYSPQVIQENLQSHDW